MPTVRPGLGGRGTKSTAPPGGDDAHYEGGQLQDLDERDDGDADPEAELAADVGHEPDQVIVG